jgi:hypothetical protein
MLLPINSDYAIAPYIRKGSRKFNTLQSTTKFLDFKFEYRRNQCTEKAVGRIVSTRY